MKVNTQLTAPQGEKGYNKVVFSFLGTFLGPGGCFKELDGQPLDGEHSSVSLLLPLLILPPEALHTPGTQTLRLKGYLLGGDQRRPIRPKRHLKVV